MLGQFRGAADIRSQSLRLFEFCRVLLSIMTRRPDRTQPGGVFGLILVLVLRRFFI